MKLFLQKCSFALVLLFPFCTHAVEPLRVVKAPDSFVFPKSSMPHVSAPSDTLVEIAQLYPHVLAETMSFGDTDHDGLFEVAFDWRDSSFVWHYVILEEQGNNVYSAELIGNTELLPYALDDLDQDGKSEVIGQFGSVVQVFESLDANSYPTELVWSSPPVSNFEGFTIVGDSDRDGKMEIIHSSGSLLLIFENTGDNTYAQVFSAFTGPQGTGEKVLADLDGDGLLEIAFSGSCGVLHIYESPSDNVWIETFTDTTVLRNSTALAGGKDTDGNGIPELFVGGELDQGFQKTTLIYEATGDNQFAQVASLSTPVFNIGGAQNTIGDMDGTGKIQYVFGTPGTGLWIYQASAIGQWDLRLTVPDPSQLSFYEGVHLFDANQNGRMELFWDSFVLPTLVLEHPGIATDVNDGNDGNNGNAGNGLEQLGMASLTPYPNPCRTGATILLQAAAKNAARFSVYNVAGRLVERRFLNPGQQRSVYWQARGLSAGVYLLRLENSTGAAIAKGRGTVVR